MDMDQHHESTSIGIRICRDRAVCRSRGRSNVNFHLCQPSQAADPMGAAGGRFDLVHILDVPDDRFRVSSGNVLGSTGQGLEDPAHDPRAIQAFKISGRKGGLLALFSTHPPLELRIARLEMMRE